MYGLRVEEFSVQGLGFRVQCLGYNLSFECGESHILNPKPKTLNP